MSTTKELNILEHTDRPMSRESVTVLYSANGIRFEKCELYRDFIQSLMVLVFDTYMGDDFTNSEQQMNHFKWCWDKNRDNFLKESININSEKLYNYFLEFMLEVYYPLSDKNNSGNTVKNIMKLWSYMFDYNTLKSQSDINTFIDIYQLFEKAIKPAIQ